MLDNKKLIKIVKFKIAIIKPKISFFYFARDGRPFGKIILAQETSAAHVWRQKHLLKSLPTEADFNDFNLADMSYQLTGQ